MFFSGFLILCKTLSVSVMDYYRALGLSRNATKTEIKEAFRKLALQFHPDKHSMSPTAVRDGAALKFKQVAEAYEVLIDDRKRADYNRGFGSSNAGGGFAGGYGYSDRNSYKPRYRRSYASNEARGFFDMDMAFRFLTSRGFLLNLAFASTVLGASVLISRSGDALWKMQNSGMQPKIGGMERLLVQGMERFSRRIEG